LVHLAIRRAQTMLVAWIEPGSTIANHLRADVSAIE
jgi:hypothetical protein